MEYAKTTPPLTQIVFPPLMEPTVPAAKMGSTLTAPLLKNVLLALLQVLKLVPLILVLHVMIALVLTLVLPQMPALPALELMLQLNVLLVLKTQQVLKLVLPALLDMELMLLEMVANNAQLSLTVLNVPLENALNAPPLMESTWLELVVNYAQLFWLTAVPALQENVILVLPDLELMLV
jgi:hypothetical protein